MTPKELSRRRPLPLTVVLALSLMLATSSLLVQQAMTQGNYNVTILDLSFSPEKLCIEKGDMVVWTNNDPVICTLWFVRADDETTYLLSDPIAPGESWAHTFNEPVKLLYYDFSRLWITGKVYVLPVLGDFTGPEDPPGSGQYPPDLIVDVYDLAALGKAYGSSPTSPNWNEDADLAGPEEPPASGQYPPDNTIDTYDLDIIDENYGRIDP